MITCTDSSSCIAINGTTTTLSSVDNPGHSSFIINPVNPSDWRNPQNNNLWQVVGGANNPCPEGFRVPTETEWHTERQSWISNDHLGAFASPLKLVLAGSRSSAGSLSNLGSYGFYWSSTVDTDPLYSIYFLFGSGYAGTDDNSRGSAYNIRCIKD